jgi:2-keto-4-pentenoate hydratase/2-oxohepta-3-ene-1,7-dioic acid hydratase in catechol pathway
MERLERHSRVEQFLGPLEPGDVIATGTPAGAGFKRQPPVLLKDGDVVEVEIEKIGRLANPVHDWNGIETRRSGANRISAEAGIK